MAERYHVDVDALTAAMMPPSVKLDGITYKGRILSFFEWMPFRDELLAIAGGKEPSQEFVQAYFRTVYPKRRFRPDPVPKILALPESALAEVVKSFFLCQMRSVRVPLPAATMTEDGTTSLPEAPPSS